MNVLQAWLLAGIPGLAVVAALFVGRSMVRAWIGYLALAGLVVLFVTTPGGGISAAFLGALAVVLVATGRGTNVDRGYREHHQDRKRFTTAT